MSLLKLSPKKEKTKKLHHALILLDCKQKYFQFIYYTKIQKRPGDLTKKYTTFKKNDDGFAEHITTQKPDPRHWLSKGTGTGGLAGTQAKEIVYIFFININDRYQKQMVQC